MWRDLARHVDALANDTRLRIEQVADQIAALAAGTRETDRRLRELGEATDVRTAVLVSVIGTHVREGHSQR